MLQIRLDGGLPGHADTQRLDDCSFGALWRAMVDEAAVIGYCTPVALCDTNAASSDAGTAACTPLADLGKAVLVFTDGWLVIQGPGYTMGCSALVFDDEGRLVSGNVPILDWADCRWDSYAGKSYYYRCVSE